VQNHRNFWRLIERRHRHRRPPHFSVVLHVNEFSIILDPYLENVMSTKVTVGHTIALAISFLDQHGNQMVAPQTPDAAPAWSNSNAAAETLAPAADGLSAVATAVAAGADTVSLSLAVGGKSFSASLDVEVDAEAQVLTSVAIVPTVSA
jgi:hypothetical protein